MYTVNSPYNEVAVPADLVFIMEKFGNTTANYSVYIAKIRNNILRRFITLSVI